jgi:hypothetical protein
MPFNPEQVAESVEKLKAVGTVGAGPKRMECVGVGTRKVKYPEIDLYACVGVTDPQKHPHFPDFECTLQRQQLAIVLRQARGCDWIEVSGTFKVSPMSVGAKWKVVDGAGKTVGTAKGFCQLPPAPSQRFLNALRAKLGMKSANANDEAEGVLVQREMEFSLRSG